MSPFANLVLGHVLRCAGLSEDKVTNAHALVAERVSKGRQG
jgi:hypothetical protein